MATHPNQSKADTLHKALEGRWRVVYSELNGAMTPVSDFSTIEIEHKGGRFLVKKNGEIVDEGKFVINADITPHEITYIYSKGADIFLGAPRAGVFQIQGDTLKTCFGAIGLRAPKELNTTLESESVLSICQRAGSEGGTGLVVSPTRAISQW